MMMRGIGKLAGASLQFTANPPRDMGRQWVGDAYRVDITGGTPNTQVLLRRTGSAGQLQRVAGQTDANGNFTQGGNFTDQDLGTWLDYWYVGSDFAGYYQLIVGTAPIGASIMSYPLPATTIPAAPPPPLPTVNPTSGTWQEQILEGTTPAQIAIYNAANTPAPAPIVTTGGAQPTPTPIVTTPPTGELIPGVSNTYLLAGVGGVLLLLAMRK